jgi:hypothetical protein
LATPCLPVLASIDRDVGKRPANAFLTVRRSTTIRRNRWTEHSLNKREKSRSSIQAKTPWVADVIDRLNALSRRTRTRQDLSSFLSQCGPIVPGVHPSPHQASHYTQQLAAANHSNDVGPKDMGDITTHFSFAGWHRPSPLASIALLENDPNRLAELK